VLSCDMLKVVADTMGKRMTSSSSSKRGRSRRPKTESPRSNEREGHQGARRRGRKHEAGISVPEANVPVGPLQRERVRLVQRVRMGQSAVVQAAGPRVGSRLPNAPPDCDVG
jgi:hypothetical protein